jgi:Uma2 family endonuclease
MTLLEQMVHSPRLPQYVRELKEILVAERPKRRQFLDALREDQKAEFINGEVVVHSPVASEHEMASFNLAQLMNLYVQKHDLGRVTHEKALISLTRNDYEPDICFFDATKAAAIKPRQMKFPAPDLIVEVLSPSTERIDRTTKFEDYADHGVGEYWIVDPAKRTIEQYLLSGDQYELEFKGRTGRIKCKVIDGLDLPVRAVFDSKENLKAIAQIVTG